MTINCNGQLLDLSTPKVMGILNITPNSFYDGGKYSNETEIISQVKKMLDEGADIIDIGAYSSKPNAEFVSEQEEIERIKPIVKLLCNEFENIILSIDTFRANVAEVCIQNGASIINDIAAGNLDESMFEIIAKYNVPYIMMHMRGTPNTMQQLTNYKDLVHEMLFYFSEKIKLARSYKINDLIIDPGFGFSKTLDQNYELLNKLELFSILELPILVGVSRKSMLYKYLDISSLEALNATSIVNTISISKGANILRVHDVKEAVECIKIYEKMKNYA